MIIKYTSAKLGKLKAQGKNGVMVPDSNGYYTTIIGALNIENSIGERYVFNDRAKSLFDKSSMFQARVQRGVVRGELGHPKMLPGMTKDKYINRMFEIHEHNVAVHYSDISLDTAFGRNNPSFGMPDLVAIMARFAPSGPHAAVTERGMKNGEENFCFSLRGITDDVEIGGQWHRSMKNIITWDVVNEPGLFIANKYDNPAIESIDVSITMAQIAKAVESKTYLPGLAIEDSKAILLDTYRSLLADADTSPVKHFKKAVQQHSILSQFK